MDLKISTTQFDLGREICRTENSFSAESDLIVPDNMPDILSVLQISANAATSACDPQTDRVLLTGNVFFNILYVADTPKREVRAINTGAMFSNIFSASGVKDTMPVFSEVNVASVSYKLTNCRKLSVHAELSGRVRVASVSKITLPTEIEGAETITAPIVCSVVKAVGNAQEAVTDSFEISPAKPAITEILRDEVKVTEKTVKIIHNKAIVKGTLCACVLYASENGIQQVKNDIPFTKVVNVEGLEEDMDVECTIDVQGWETETSSGESGENRTVDVETMLYFTVIGRVASSCEAIVDAYYPGYKIECERERLSYCAPPKRETEECAVRGTIKLPAVIGDIETVYDINGCPKITRIRNDGGELAIEGTATVSLLFKTDNADCPITGYSYDIDFSHSVSGEAWSEPPRVSAELKNMSFNVANGGIEVRGTAALTLEESDFREQNVVTDVKLCGEAENTAPSILISYINDDNSLWEISKKYNISRSKLMAANDISSEEELKKRRALVIPR